MKDAIFCPFFNKLKFLFGQHTHTHTHTLAIGWLIIKNNGKKQVNFLISHWIKRSFNRFNQTEPAVFTLKVLINQLSIDFENVWPSH